jgi:cytochrome c oxidase cbb3-type subunit 2
MVGSQAGNLIRVILLLVAGAWIVLVAAAGLTAQETTATGRQIYVKYCAECHGETGKGDGSKAPVNPRPRDFTSGKFKFRSTPSGSLPMDDDLLRTITVGVPGTEMRGWDSIPEPERREVVQHIKSFSDAWKNKALAAPIKLSSPPSYLKSEASIAKGQEWYREAECFKCHGENGEGDGPDADKMKDDWGQPIKPADFTAGRFKSGPSPLDLYRTIATGIGGTPMPSFLDSLSEEEIWHLVSFILSLKGPF